MTKGANYFYWIVIIPMACLFGWFLFPSISSWHYPNEASNFRCTMAHVGSTYVSVPLTGPGSDGTPISRDVPCDRFERVK